MTLHIWKDYRSPLDEAAREARRERVGRVHSWLRDIARAIACAVLMATAVSTMITATLMFNGCDSSSVSPELREASKSAVYADPDALPFEVLNGPHGQPMPQIENPKVKRDVPGGPVKVDNPPPGPR